MNWMQPPERLARRAHIRERLRGILEFADDDVEAVRRTDLVYANCGYQWFDDARKLQNLELEAILATSTDAPEQSIGNTVTNDEEFWSSTGSDKRTAGDALLYRVRQPLTHVSYVSLAVYRAFYQLGDPLYPPHKVSFLTGPTPNQLYPASPVYPVRLTDSQQVFAVSPTAPVSQYLMVRLHGRVQRQREDSRFYIAIRHVGAYGTVLPPNHYSKALQAATAKGLTWPCSRGLVTEAVPEPPAAAAAPAAGGRARGGGSGAGSSAAAREEGREEGDLPRAEVYEAGPTAFLTARGATSSSSCCSSSSPRWVNGRWSSRRHPKRPAEATAEETGTTALGWGLSYFRGGTAGSASASSNTAAAAAAAAAASAAHQRVPGPTGPTDSELSAAVGQAALARAVRQIGRVSWPEVLIVHGVPVQDLDLAPSSDLISTPSVPATAKLDSQAQQQRQLSDSGGVDELALRAGSSGGDSGDGGSGASSGGGGAPDQAVLAEIRRERMQHEQEWLRAAAAAAAAAAASSSAAAATAQAPPASTAPAPSAAANSHPAAAAAAAESSRLAELLAAAATSGGGGALPSGWMSMLAAAVPAASEPPTRTEHLRQTGNNLFSKMLTALFKKSPGGSGGGGGGGGGGRSRDQVPPAGGGSMAFVGGSSGTDCGIASECARARADVARERAVLVELSYLVACVPSLGRHPRAQSWLQRLRLRVGVKERRLLTLERQLSSTSKVVPGGGFRFRFPATKLDYVLGRVKVQAQRQQLQQQQEDGVDSSSVREARLTRRCQQAAHRAMQDLSFTVNGPLFVVDEGEWAGGEARQEQQEEQQGGQTMELEGNGGGAEGFSRSGGSCGDGEGQGTDAQLWLVSHYDNEHL